MVGRAELKIIWPSELISMVSIRAAKIIPTLSAVFLPWLGSAAEGVATSALTTGSSSALKALAWLPVLDVGLFATIPVLSCIP
jgi:hypothetical protein